ncbi:hypothetical protein BKP29_0220985, partial [Bacillus licheniformis]
MAYHNREKEITNILKNHERKANQLLRLAQSSRLLDTFNKIWVSIENKELPNFVSKNVMDFNVADIKSEINDWIKDLKECQENARRKFESMEDPTPEDLRKRNNISSDAVLLISQYENLKNGIDQVEQDFSNVAR